jgi:hypothetical protein
MLTSGHMPRGYGKCQHCGEYGWLPDGPVDVECEECVVVRLLARADAAMRAQAPDGPQTPVPCDDGLHDPIPL